MLLDEAISNSFPSSRFSLLISFTTCSSITTGSSTLSVTISSLYNVIPLFVSVSEDLFSEVVNILLEVTFGLILF